MSFVNIENEKSFCKEAFPMCLESDRLDMAKSLVISHFWLESEIAWNCIVIPVINNNEKFDD